VINFVGSLFSLVIPPDHHDKAEIVFEVALNTITLIFNVCLGVVLDSFTRYLKSISFLTSAKTALNTKQVEG
jgi:hypothetical protein